MRIDEGGGRSKRRERGEGQRKEGWEEGRVKEGERGEGGGRRGRRGKLRKERRSMKED